MLVFVPKYRVIGGLFAGNAVNVANDGKTKVKMVTIFFVDFPAGDFWALMSVARPNGLYKGCGFI